MAGRTPHSDARRPHRIRWEKTTAVAVKIKLKRMGKIREPYYRIIVADARTKRDGRAIEEIGKYHPKADPSLIEVNSDRAQHWLSVGAQPTDPVRKLLEVTGDWQRFKGVPGAEGTLKTAQARSDKKEIFAAALAETLAESGATTAKGRGKAGGAKAGDGKAGDGKASDAKADKPTRASRADTGKADGGKADGGKADGGKADGGKAHGGRAGAGKPKAGKANADEVAEQAPAGAEADGGAAQPGGGD
jgi:small subunit ribosomal protein S16